MPVRGKRLTADLIAEVATIARSRLKPEAAPLAEEFIRRFYAHVPPSDLLGIGAETLYGAALSMYRFAAERPAETPKIRVYSPTLGEQGWQSQHTVVEIVNDDMPFLVDSVTAELNRHGHTVHLVIHPIIPIRREGGRLCAIGGDGASAESVMHVQMDEVTAPEELDAVRAGLTRVLSDVRVAVADWQAIRTRLQDTIAEVRDLPAAATSLAEADEVAAFLAWLDDNHFTFLGCRDYSFGGMGDELHAMAVPDSSLGILRGAHLDFDDAPAGLAVLPAAALGSLKGPGLVDINKASARATVHRAVHMDYVTVKRFDAGGNVSGVRRFLGLFTSVVYNSSPRRIPILRRKVADVIAAAGFGANSHDEKALVHILEAYPRDELFQIAQDDLLDTALGILHLQERQRIALFCRQDPFQRFVSCLVYVPRDRYSTEIRLRFARILETALSGEVTAFNTQVSDEPLARVQFVVRTTPGEVPDFDPQEIEQRLAEAGRSWSDRLQQALVAQLGEERGLAAWRSFGASFPAGYREGYSAEVAVADIAVLETMGDGRIGMNLYRPIEAADHELRFKLYHGGAPLPLSDVLPMLEDMGLRVIGEVPYRLEPADAGTLWIHDFVLETADRSAVDLRRVRADFQTAFERVWSGEMESDGLNRLILAAGLGWRHVVVLRAFARYLRQIGVPFSQAYMEETLARHAGIAAGIVDLFVARFDPDARDDDRAERSAGAVRDALEQVESLDEDRILRRFLNLAEAATRTNHWQRGDDGQPKSYLAIKYDCARIDELPLPRPMFEIFVYSPRMEGVHLRGGKVARGGIRWSDRREDFRTEVLGLMKAQMVKNAVIVPVGAKGGFVVKRPPAAGGREALQAEGVACYRLLVRGLLDVTDNLDGDTVVPPRDVVRRDGDDPYIVVAADKGTATFSDIANALSAEYGFWLKDAFASGGSAGYDHKGMGITARGAWESVKRHFREQGRDIQTEDFTCVGVGDMAGDVFGNGMLLSKHTKLVAAFNHMHIFVDPEPDPARSWEERKRLFDQPRSAWSDYDSGLISKGGG
ncbi:MAG: NAD-glutamate dehydrogenase, partial [Alphaproteobacteria bacterium]